MSPGGTSFKFFTKFFKRNLLLWERYVELTDEQKSIIMHSRKSLLFADGSHWVKKEGDPDFDVTMGSYDGTELCEFVGLYILHRLGEKFGVDISGLYRDDGLLCFEQITGHVADSIRKDMIKLFDEEFKLKIVNFLDITFNLKKRHLQTIPSHQNKKDLSDI